MNDLTAHILHQLVAAAPNFVSGSELARHHHLSSTAIWKHISHLRADGYEIESVTGKGYRLVAMSGRPVQAEVQPFLTTQQFGRRIHFYPEIVSTNITARALAVEGASEGEVVVANQQQGGKGRMGRSWVSPPNVNLYASIIVRPHVPLLRVPQLTLLVAVALHQALAKLAPTVPALIKWPNDLLVKGKKVAGILCEMFSEPELVHFVIVGIGINVNQAEIPTELEERATSLYGESGERFSRPHLLAEILNCFERLYQQWLQENDLSFILPYLEQYSSLINQEVVIEQGNRTISGTVLGLAAGGELRLACPDGKSVTISSGEAHLRQQ